MNNSLNDKSKKDLNELKVLILSQKWNKNWEEEINKFYKILLKKSKEK